MFRGTTPHNSTFPRKRLCVGLTSLILAYRPCRHSTTDATVCQAIIHNLCTDFFAEKMLPTATQERESRGARGHRVARQLVARRRRACPSPPCYKIVLFCWVGWRGGAALPSRLFWLFPVAGGFSPPATKQGILYNWLAHSVSAPRLLPAPVEGRSAWLALR